MSVCFKAEAELGICS